MLFPLIKKCIIFIYFLFRVPKDSNSNFKWILNFLGYKKITIPKCILLSTLALNHKVVSIIPLCLEGGVRSTDEFSALLLQSFWHCSFTSFKNKHLTAFLNGWHCMIISAIWWVVHPVNISVANMSTVLVPSYESGSTLSWYKF